MHACSIVKKRRSKNNPRPWKWEVVFVDVIADSFGLGFTYPSVFVFGESDRDGWLASFGIVSSADYSRNVAKISNWLARSGVSEYEIRDGSIMFEHETDAMLCRLSF